MRVARKQLIIVGVLLGTILAPRALAGASENDSAQTPHWEKEFVVWPRHEGQPTPWRDDSRFSALSPEGYPDDFPVYFDNPDPTVKDEIMWVTAIDYSAVTDEYLGILLNSPNNLRSITDRDNAVFRYDPEAEQLRALAVDGNYGTKGLPPRAGQEVFSELWRGIRQYRLGNYGHNQAAIEQCISILSSATQQLENTASADDAYLAYFVLGRCHAEAYNTDAAIEAFRTALEHKRDDVDAHMALLAEYSIKVHPPVDQAKEAYDASYEPLFLEKLRYVREHFFDDAGVAVITTIIFDESEATGLSELTAEEIARRRELGFGTFRWKRH